MQNSFVLLYDQNIVHSYYGSDAKWSYKVMLHYFIEFSASFFFFLTDLENQERMLLIAILLKDLQINQRILLLWKQKA
jgi:hypothetical protein